MHAWRPPGGSHRSSVLTRPESAVFARLVLGRQKAHVRLHSGGPLAATGRDAPPPDLGRAPAPFLPPPLDHPSACVRDTSTVTHLHVQPRCRRGSGVDRRRRCRWRPACSAASSACPAHPTGVRTLRLQHGPLCVDSNNCQPVRMQCGAQSVAQTQWYVCDICSSYVPQPRTLLHAVDARIKQVQSSESSGCDMS